LMVGLAAQAWPAGKAPQINAAINKTRDFIVSLQNEFGAAVRFYSVFERSG
jgi:hypothetical protein